jgi:hypothetical protein
MTTPQSSTKVLVSNISPSANEKTLAGFFSFCGTIINIKLNSYPDAPGEAVVEFDSEAAAKTALLLTNAVIADRPITVTVYSDSSTSGSSTFNNTPGGQSVEISGSDIPNRNNLPADQRTQTSVIASLLAAGYTLGTDTFEKARQYDEQNHISQSISAAAAAARDKILELDQQLKISETTSNLASGVATKTRELDQQWGISATTSNIFKNIADTVEVGVNAITTKAKESPAIQATVSSLSHAAENVSNYMAPTAEAVKSNVESIREQTNQNIEERQRQRSSSVEKASAPAPPPEPSAQ